MVAYSFKSGFVPRIIDGSKRQTIRLPRKRHARVGESIQLFTAMRTRNCRKIIPDPLCIGIDEVSIDLRTDDVSIVVNGIPIIGAEADAYAIGDGFGGYEHALPPFAYMVRWWQLTHGRTLFEGVAIRWQPSAGEASHA